jgi:transcriptional regulator with XRE-family HTH domain
MHSLASTITSDFSSSTFVRNNRTSCLSARDGYDSRVPTTQKKRPRVGFAVTFGLFVELKREERGWTQEQLGAEAHCSKQTVSGWENSGHQPDEATMERVFGAFGYEMHEGLEELSTIAKGIFEGRLVPKGMRKKLAAVTEPLPGGRAGWARRRPGRGDQGDGK